MRKPPQKTDMSHLANQKVQDGQVGKVGSRCAIAYAAKTQIEIVQVNAMLQPGDVGDIRIVSGTGCVPEGLKGRDSPFPRCLPLWLRQRRGWGESPLLLQSWPL